MTVSAQKQVRRDAEAALGLSDTTNVKSVENIVPERTGDVTAPTASIATGVDLAASSDTGEKEDARAGIAREALEHVQTTAGSADIKPEADVSASEEAESGLKKTQDPKPEPGAGILVSHSAGTPGEDRASIAAMALATATTVAGGSVGATEETGDSPDAQIPTAGISDEPAVSGNDSHENHVETVSADSGAEEEKTAETDDAIVEIVREDSNVPQAASVPEYPMDEVVEFVSASGGEDQETISQQTGTPGKKRGFFARLFGLK